ncbi:hypothetical protein BJ508DRAFT_411787 [Ascobolus immersus RN42]|uniref:Uncharacterized protein n=1 Tax=Ascobolus immersus RN42 TaxID=1160509 RepID=A0A3N4IK54_ASCIM|nr:hypothetical protein BJ508DRAFT_411787 [Ascobolus immersus RN42]
MPISKKARIQREHKKAEAAGTRAPVKANGVPVKAPKPLTSCAYCKREVISTNLEQMRLHAAGHDGKNWPVEKCFPKEFPTAP